MMRQKLITFLLVSIVISSIFFISTEKMTTAEECNDCNPIPTPPGNADYCKINPLKFSSVPDEITCGTPVIIKIVYGKAPFTWQVSGNGFTISEINEREYSLSCNSGCACGDGNGEASAVTTISVTDSCNPQNIVTKTIRNTSGDWSAGNVDDWYAETTCAALVAGCSCATYYKVEDGIYRTAYITQSCFTDGGAQCTDLPTTWTGGVGVHYPEDSPISTCGHVCKYAGMTGTCGLKNVHVKKWVCP